MYKITKEILSKHNYNQYEISNYAKENRECFHNKIYWKCEDYLGVGVSASSFVNNVRFKNIDSIEEYIKNINEDKSIEEEAHENSLEDSMEEFVFMGLRMINGINICEFEERFNINIYDVYAEVIKRYIDEELLAIEKGNIYLTPKGIELSNYVMSDFILT